jgi:two-component system, LuxR family, sensor kinase FixL
MKDYARLTRAELIQRIEDLKRQTIDNEADRAEGRQTKAALRDSEERLRTILETAVEGIITIDERGVIESLNVAAENIFGYTAAELIGQNVSQLMPAPYHDAHDGYLANYRQTGHPKIIGIGREVVGKRKNGEVFPMDLSVSEVRLATRRLFTGFVRDITERKRLEKEILEISNREQQRIGQDLHDGLCQELAGIELMCQVQQQKLASRSKAEAERVAEIARHVRQAISHTRDLARGLSPVELQAEGLMSALQELAVNVEKMFRIECRYECERPVLIHNSSAATHLYRIAQEAINNAVKHGKAKMVVVSLESNGNQAALTVVDDGIGFPKELRQNTGMGLRIMKYRADMIGGALELRRANGRGTVVACTFGKHL